MNGYRRGGGITWLLLILYLVFGLYFINYALNYFLIPQAIKTTLDTYNKWIVFVGGVLIIIGAINHFRLSRYIKRYRSGY